MRRLPDESLSCELAGTPGTSRILGKADHVLHAGPRAVTPRDLAEIYEALPSEPWPARFAAREQDDCVVLSVPASVVLRSSPEALEAQFDAAGIAVRVEVADAAVPAQRLKLTRSDLRETTFTGKTD